MNPQHDSGNDDPGLARDHGLAVQALWEAPIRHDQGRPVMGWYVLLAAQPLRRATQ